MKISEAIKVLTDVRKIADPNGKKGYWEALGLGIEALKEIKKSREEDYIGDTGLLPGETEE